ncbi:MAG: hypothetical protein Q8Q02_04560 [Nocardioides sp.]|nr:hypothetical protein [Nocardioides sp.]
MSRSPASPPPSGPPEGDPTGRPAIPGTLWLAAALVAVEGLALVVLGVAELFAVTGDRALMGVTTSVFFLGFGGGLVACAWGMTRPWTWVRGPVVLAQLIQLGVAWSFRGGDTAGVSVALTVSALVVLVLVLLPSSTAVLLDDEE